MIQAPMTIHQTEELEANADISLNTVAFLGGGGFFNAGIRVDIQGARKRGEGGGANLEILGPWCLVQI